MSAPPIVIKFLKVTRTRRKIVTHYKKGDDDFKTASTENALPEFQHTMDATLPMFVRHCDCPPSYSENTRVVEIQFAEQGDARVVRAVLHKHLPEAHGPVKIETPWRYLNNPTKEGTVVSKPIPAKEVELVQAFEDAARDYVIGKRAQGVLPGIGLVEDSDAGEGDDDDENQGKLPVGEPGSEDGPPAPPPASDASAPAGKKRGPKKKDGTIEKFPGHGDAHP